jgi:hypothetical protein
LTKLESVREHFAELVQIAKPMLRTQLQTESTPCFMTQ